MAVSGKEGMKALKSSVVRLELRKLGDTLSEWGVQLGIGGVPLDSFWAHDTQPGVDCGGKLQY